MKVACCAWTKRQMQSIMVKVWPQMQYFRGRFLSQKNCRPYMIKYRSLSIGKSEPALSHLRLEMINSVCIVPGLHVKQAGDLLTFLSMSRCHEMALCGKFYLAKAGTPLLTAFAAIFYQPIRPFWGCILLGCNQGNCSSFRVHFEILQAEPVYRSAFQSEP